LCQAKLRWIVSSFSHLKLFWWWNYQGAAAKITGIEKEVKGISKELTDIAKNTKEGVSWGNKIWKVLDAGARVSREAPDIGQGLAKEVVTALTKVCPNLWFC